MKSILVKDLMVPIGEYATVRQNANLHEAVLALEEAQKAFDSSKHKHRAILVLDDQKNVVGKISMFRVMMSLEPKIAKLEAEGVLTRSGHSKELIDTLLEDSALWSEPLESLCYRAAKLLVADFMELPEDGSYIDETATLGEAIHRFVLRKHHSLIVKSGDTVTGMLRLSDVFTAICERIKACEL